MTGLLAVIPSPPDYGSRSHAPRGNEMLSWQRANNG